MSTYVLWTCLKLVNQVIHRQSYFRCFIVILWHHKISTIQLFYEHLDLKRRTKREYWIAMVSTNYVKTDKNCQIKSVLCKTKILSQQDKLQRRGYLGTPNTTSYYRIFHPSKPHHQYIPSFLHFKSFHFVSTVSAAVAGFSSTAVTAEVPYFTVNPSLMSEPFPP